MRRTLDLSMMSVMESACCIFRLFCHLIWEKLWKHRSECPYYLNTVIRLWLSITSVSVSRCVNHACSPSIGNLASGRTLLTLSSSFHRSPCPHHPVTPDVCPEDSHPSAHMTDDPFLHPDTWWASGAGTGIQEQQDEIRLDLETQFCLTHVVLVFRSPRPAAMAIERSADFGRTWEALKLYAHNCSKEFGLPDDVIQPGSLCTSRYTGATPCIGGEVREYAEKCLIF